MRPVQATLIISDAMPFFCKFPATSMVGINFSVDEWELNANVG